MAAVAPSMPNRSVPAKSTANSNLPELYFMALFPAVTQANADFIKSPWLRAFPLPRRNIADTLSLPMILFTTDRKRR